MIFSKGAMCGGPDEKTELAGWQEVER